MGPAQWVALGSAQSPPSQATTAPVYQGAAGEQALTKALPCIFIAILPASGHCLMRMDKGSHIHTDMEGVDVMYLVS